jgi:hypothetical protein
MSLFYRIARIELLIILTILVGVNAAFFFQEPKVPPFPWSIQPPVIGRYCVMTKAGGERFGAPLGMSIWTSMSLKSPEGEGPDWACADMPNPMIGD